MIVYIWQHDSGSKAWGIVSLVCTLAVAVLKGSIAKANYVTLQFEQQEAEHFFTTFEQLVKDRCRNPCGERSEAFEMYVRTLHEFNAFYVREPALLPGDTHGLKRYCHVITGLFFCD